VHGCAQNLWQRTLNVLMYYGSKVVEQVRCLPKYSELARNFDFDMWRKEVVHGTAMFIFNMDFSLEWPRALPPTIKFVGALLPESAKPLPPNFEVRNAGLLIKGHNWCSPCDQCIARTPFHYNFVIGNMPVTGE
jgi:hypothetical protein